MSLDALPALPFFFASSSFDLLRCRRTSFSTASKEDFTELIISSSMLESVELRIRRSPSKPSLLAAAGLSCVSAPSPRFCFERRSCTTVSDCSCRAAVSSS